MRHMTLENVSVELLRATICRGEGAVHAAQNGGKSTEWRKEEKVAGGIV